MLIIYDAFQTVDLEREEGKMTSQERFWQAFRVTPSEIETGFLAKNANNDLTIWIQFQLGC